MPSDAAQPEAVESVSPQEAFELIESGAILVDVREDHEWAQVRAPQARHLPMSRFTQVDAESLPTDRPIICVCHLGVRSAAVAQALARGGWTAMNLTGGMDAWQAAGLPVNTNTPETDTPEPETPGTDTPKTDGSLGVHGGPSQTPQSRM